jgi:hypothetical protein
MGDDMNKKILALLSFFIVIAGMSAASAIDFNEISDLIMGTPDNNVNVSGIDFNIPDGFKELDNESFENDNPLVDYNTSSKTFMNNSGDVIILSVSFSSDIPVDDNFAKEASLGGNKTTINGVEGYESTDPNFYDFTFAKDEKLVIISASDKELINDIKLA